jgi:hypothetical protein
MLLRCRSRPRAIGMFGDKFGHLEHAHLVLAIKYRPECIICIDHGSFLFILTTVPLDVVPKLFSKLGTRQWLRPDDGSKFVVRLDRSHEGGIRSALGGFLFGLRHNRRINTRPK